MEENATNLSQEQVLKKYEAKAADILQDEDKFERTLERIERKLGKMPIVGSYLADIPTLISLVKAWFTKEYADVPWGTIIGITTSLLYFLSPVDLIPDSIPGVGYLDDSAVILGTIKMFHDDIEEYKTWQEKNGKRTPNSSSCQKEKGEK